MYDVKFVAHFEHLFGTLGGLAFSLRLPHFSFLYDVIVSDPRVVLLYFEVAF